MTRFYRPHIHLVLLVSILIFAGLLRLVHLSTLPPAPYWEEVALGYDAYSVAKTARDHHGNPLPIVAFESFGDWKPSLYFYVSIPAITAFGLNVWSVRLPSALAGIGIVFLMYLLPQLLLKLSVKERQIARSTIVGIGLIAAAVTAISPWAVTFSRVAWESNVATFLLLSGVVAFLFSLQKSTRKIYFWQVLAILCFDLSAYTYHAARIIAPLMVTVCFLCLAYFGHKRKIAAKKILLQLLGLGLFFSFLLLPLLINLTSAEVSSRFATENVFSNIHVIEQSNLMQDIAGHTLLSRILYHRYVLFAHEVLANVASYLQPNFLFGIGDTNLRHTTGYLGLLYPIEILFLFSGIIVTFKRYRFAWLFLTIWLLGSLLPAAVSTPNPHALRTLASLPVWLTFIALGMYYLLYWVIRSSTYLIAVKLNLAKQKITSLKKYVTVFFVAVVILLYIGQFSAFLIDYVFVYPKRTASWWQSGYQELFSAIDAAENRLGYTDIPIYISRQQGRPAMYDWFFHKTDPRIVQNQMNVVPKDQSEALAFNNRIYFRQLPDISQRPALLAISPVEWEQEQYRFDPEKVAILSSIAALDNSTVWLLLELQ